MSKSEDRSTLKPGAALRREEEQRARTVVPTPEVYARMQTVIQKMQHSECGVAVRPFTRRFMTVVPCAFTGADLIQWIAKNLDISNKVEALHFANLLVAHGYIFCVDGVDVPVRDDNSMYRFQMSAYWPSNNPTNTEFDYAVYMVKQVLRSKHRIRLLPYELENITKIKHKLGQDWKQVTEKAELDLKNYRSQKRDIKTVLASQEEAFWRIWRPASGHNHILDILFTRCHMGRTKWFPQIWTEETLKSEVGFLQRSLQDKHVHMSTSLEGMLLHCRKYAEYDPMLTPPPASNPWVTGDILAWTMEKSLVENPSEQQVRKWGCSLLDLLNDVTGRYRFEVFCKKTFCIENVRFWQACRDLKTLPLVAVNGSVKLIYDEFLERGASSEVNVGASVASDIAHDLATPSRFSFQSAQEQIFSLMQNDIYPRFLKSSDYTELLSGAKKAGGGGGWLFGRLIPSGRRPGQQYRASMYHPVGIVSPCNPDRYTRRQLSIGQKINNEQSASLDDIYLVVGEGGGGGRRGGGGDEVDGGGNGRKSSGEAAIKTRMTVGGTRRRTSQPNTSPIVVKQGGPMLDHLLEFDSSPTALNLKPLAVLGTSCSAEGIAQLVEGDDGRNPFPDADTLGLGFQSNTLGKKSKRVRSKSVEHPTNPRRPSADNIDPDAQNPAF
ncbi:hypothetical protein EMCRGX_G027570 [Ephydatia muelleri]|eukprot:Em0020g1011a